MAASAESGHGASTELSRASPLPSPIGFVLPVGGSSEALVPAINSPKASILLLDSKPSARLGSSPTRTPRVAFSTVGAGLSVGGTGVSTSAPPFNIA
eukprot:scaffold244920_cov24-Tisochrysis_lutea.AAC.2